MIHDEHHRALVRRLAAEVKPTRRLWPVSIRLAAMDGAGNRDSDVGHDR